MEQQNNTQAEQSPTTGAQLPQNINAQTPATNTNNTTSLTNTANTETEEINNNEEENDEMDNNEEQNISNNSNTSPLTPNNSMGQSMLGNPANNSNLFNTPIGSSLPFANDTTRAFPAPATPKTNIGLDSSFNFTQCYKDCSQSHDYKKLNDAFKKLCKASGSYNGIMNDFSSFQAKCQQHGLNVKKDGDRIVATFQGLPENDPSQIVLNKDNETALNVYQEKDQYIKSDSNADGERDTEEEETEEEEKKSNNSGAIIAIIVILLALTIIGILTYLLLKKKEEKNNDIDNTPQPEAKKDPPTITGTPNTKGPDGNEATATGNSSTLNTTVHMEVPENSTLSSQELANIQQAAQIEMNPNVLTTVNGETYSGFRIDNGTAYGFDKYGQQHNLGNYENITAFYGIEHKPISNEVMTCMNNYKQQANGNGGWDYVPA